MDVERPRAAMTESQATSTVAGAAGAVDHHLDDLISRIVDGDRAPGRPLSAFMAP
jgi:hypothetical protein